MTTMSEKSKAKFIRWARAAGIRAIRTFGQSMGGYIASAVLLSDVNWAAAFSAGAFGAVLSLVMSLAGLPEVDEEVEDGN